MASPRLNPDAPHLDDRVRAALARLGEERLNGAPLFVTVSGAHLYGFPSPDSDLDLRGAFALAPRDLLGLRAPRETFELAGHEAGLEWDVVLHDARKYFALLAKASGYVLEQVLSPLVAHSSPAHQELCEIARSSFSRAYAAHYAGFARGQWRLLQRHDPPRLKPLLYAFRTAMTGLTLVERGELVIDARVLNAEFAVDGFDELLARKRAGREDEPLDPALTVTLRPEFERLLIRLDASPASSPLPARVDVEPALNDLLLRLRFESWRRESIGDAAP